MNNSRDRAEKMNSRVKVRSCKCMLHVCPGCIHSWHATRTHSSPAMDAVPSPSPSLQTMSPLGVDVVPCAPSATLQRSRHALVAPSLRRGAHSPHVPCLTLKHALLAAHRPHAYATSDRAESYWLNDLNTRSRWDKRAAQRTHAHSHSHPPNRVRLGSTTSQHAPPMMVRCRRAHTQSCAMTHARPAQGSECRLLTPPHSCPHPIHGQGSCPTQNCQAV
jgi:hypothetical protein